MHLRLASRAVLALSIAATTIGCGPPGAVRPYARPRTTSATAIPSPPPANHGGDATDLETLQQREATVALRDYRVRVDDAGFDLHVKAAAPPTAKTRKTADGHVSTVTFSIGDDTNAVCIASTSPIDLGRWVEAVLVQGKITLVARPTVEVAVKAGQPTFFVDTDGLVELDGVKKRLFAKFAGIHLDRGSVACVHDGVGYRSTFRSVIDHVATKTVAPVAVRPTFRTIFVAREGDTVLGFEYLRQYPGETRGQTLQTSLESGIASHDNRWMSMDAGWTAIVDAKGVVSEHGIRAVAGEKVYDMKLERKASGVYSYEGTVGGGTKAGTLKSKVPLTTTLARSASIAALMRDPKRKDVSYVGFDEREPSMLLREVVRRDGSSIELESRGEKFRLEVDDHGLYTKLMKVGDALIVESVYRDGSP